MKHQLNVVGIQSDLVWEEPEQNRHHFEKKMAELPGDVDLIVLPEMFTTGFSMNAKHLVEKQSGPTLNWMKSQSRKHDAAIVGSLIFSEDNQFYNRLFFIKPDGSFDSYDKRHTFTLAKENEIYENGQHILITEYKGWRICPLICYDLRFPVWSRNQYGYDLLLYIASWPVKRISAWDTLLKARAIENMSYVIGVNRIGTDANNYEYSGSSAVIDFMGNVISALAPSRPGLVQAQLNKEEMLLTRNKLGFLNDKYQFKIL